MLGVTIRDVAKLAGVSVATVSRVINQKGYVSQETDVKVKEIMRKLRFEPNQVARGLTAKKTRTIALIVPDILNPFFPALARGVEDIANLHGYTLILCNSDGSGVKEKSYIEILRKKYVDGIIFASNHLTVEDADSLEESKIPLVILDRAPDMETNCIIRVDDYQGAVTAVEHLLDVGCRKIAHIYGPQEFKTARERLAGYENVAKKYPWFSPTLMVPGHFSIDGGRKATIELLTNHPDVDGIFAGNDLMGVGILKQLRKDNIAVPDHIALCGFDGIHLTEITEPELTTIAQPIYQMGELAAEKLIERINYSLPEKEVISLETSLIIRDSTKRKGVLKG